MEINVIDTGDPGLMKSAITLRLQLHKETIELLPGPNGIERMVHEIGKRADIGSIEVLRLYAHGNSGIINVAAGHDIKEDTLSTLSLATVGTLKPMLATLTPYFSANARVELQGCMVAKGSDGEQLMLALARIWGVRVQASPVSLPLGSVQFQGLVYEANRHGGLSCVPPTPITKG